jgi:hypothetical protein
MIIALVCGLDPFGQPAVTLAQPNIVQRCGKEAPKFTVASRLWLGSREPLSAIQREKLRNFRLTAIEKPNLWGNPRVAQSGSAIVYQTGDRTDSGELTITLNVQLDSGVVKSMPMEPNWVKLGPELKPGYFGILAYAPETFTAQVIEVDYITAPALVARTVNQFDFPVPLNGGWWRHLTDISPDWAFIGYIDSSSEIGSVTPQYVVYSSVQKRPVWSIAIGGKIPSMMWSALPGFVGALMLRESNGDSPLVLVTADGQSRELVNWSNLPLKTSVLGDHTRLISRVGEIGLLINAGGDPRNAKQYVVNVNTQQIIEYCVPSSDGFLTIYDWVDDGKFLSYLRFNSSTGLPDQFILLDVASGDFAIYVLEQGQMPLAWSK